MIDTESEKYTYLKYKCIRTEFFVTFYILNSLQILPFF